jgi:O-antigen/teichoic acid export membrane protein
VSAPPGPGAPLTGETVVRGTSYALLTQVVTAAFTAALTLYLVRALGPDEFGVFSLALALGALMLLPADLGVSYSVARFVAERRTDRAAVAALVRDGLTLKLLATAAVGVLLAALAEPIAAAYGEPALVWPLRLMAVACAGQSVLALYLGVFPAVARLDVNLRLVAGESAIEFVASVALVALGGGAVGATAGRAAGYVAGALLAVVLAARMFGPESLRLRARGPHELERVARYAGPLFVVNGAYTLFNQVDLLLIGAIVGSAAVGFFSAPLRLCALLHYPGLAVAASVAPRVARHPSIPPDTEVFARALRALIVVQAAMTAVILVWAEPIVNVLLGKRYEASVDVLRALAPFIFLQGLGPLVSGAVNFLGRAGRRVPVAVGTVSLNAVIDLILIPKIGIVGGAIGTSVAYAVYLPAHYAICRRELGLRSGPLLVTAMRSLLAAAALAGTLALAGTASPDPAAAVAAAVAGGVLFVALLMLTGELSWQDLRRGRQLVLSPWRGR